MFSAAHRNGVTVRGLRVRLPLLLARRSRCASTQRATSANTTPRCCSTTTTSTCAWRSTTRSSSSRARPMALYRHHPAR
jgi:hypothetical protein